MKTTEQPLTTAITATNHHQRTITINDIEIRENIHFQITKRNQIYFHNFHSASSHAPLQTLSGNHSHISRVFYNFVLN